MEDKKIKYKYGNEMTSLKQEMNEMREETQHFFSPLLLYNPILNIRGMLGCVGSNNASSIYGVVHKL